MALEPLGGLKVKAVAIRCIEGFIRQCQVGSVRTEVGTETIHSIQ